MNSKTNTTHSSAPSAGPTAGTLLVAFARIPIIRAASAFLIICMITLARFLPSIDSLTEQFIGGVEGDNGLYVWLFRQHINSFSAGTLFLNWFDTNGFYPYAGTLAWSDNFLLPGFLGFVLTKIGASEALAYNFLILAAYAISGLIFWIFVMRISGSMLAGLLSSIGWLSWNYWGLQIGHPQLLFHLFLPAGLYLFFCIIRQPRFLYGACASLLVVLAFATTVYYAVFLVLLWGVLSFSLIIVKPSAIFTRKQLPTLIGMLLFAPLIIPFLFPYFQTILLFGSRGLYEAHYFSAHARSWLSAPVNSTWFGFTNKLSSGEAHLFPGVIIFTLACFGCVRFARAKELSICLMVLAAFLIMTAATSWISVSAVFPYEWRLATAIGAWLSLAMLIGLGSTLRSLESKRGFTVVTHRSILFSLLAVVVVFWILSLGPLGNPEKDQLAFGPWSAVYTFMPGAASIRAVSRCGIVAMLGLCGLAGLGIGMRLHASPRLLIIAPFFALGAWIEGMMLIQPAQSLPPVPAALNTAIGLSEPSVIIGLPMAGSLENNGAPLSWTDFASKQVQFLNWITPQQSITTKLRAINGYSGQQTKLMRELPRALASFPSPRSIETLCQFPELRLVFVSAELSAKEVINTDALKRLSVDSTDNSLFGLDCGVVPFKTRELILPGKTTQIICETNSPEVISIAAAQRRVWHLRQQPDAISIQREVDYQGSSGSAHLVRIGLVATKKVTLGRCEIVQ